MFFFSRNSADQLSGIEPYTDSVRHEVATSVEFATLNKMKSTATLATLGASIPKIQSPAFLTMHLLAFVRDGMELPSSRVQKFVAMLRSESHGSIPITLVADVDAISLDSKPYPQCPL